MENIIIFISMCIQYGNKYFIGTFPKAVQKLLDYKHRQFLCRQIQCNASIFHNFANTPNYKLKTFFFGTSYNSDEHPTYQHYITTMNAQHYCTLGHHRVL